MALELLKKRLKKAHKSITNWFNISGAALLSVMLSEPTFITFLNTNDLAYIIIICNLLLRFKTSKDLADK